MEASRSSPYDSLLTIDSDFCDTVWRILIGLSLIPACLTLYQRLTLPESTRYIKAQKLASEEEALKKGEMTEKPKRTGTLIGTAENPLVTEADLQAAGTKKEQFRGETIRAS